MGTYEWGSFEGIITMENIVEQIVGEIRDEFDEEEPVVSELPDGSYSMHGGTPIEEANKALRSLRARTLRPWAASSPAAWDPPQRPATRCASTATCCAWKRWTAPGLPRLSPEKSLRSTVSASPKK